MKIGLDFDGVITDCGQLKTSGAKLLYGVDIAPEQFKREIVVGNGWLTNEQYNNLQVKIYDTREFGLQMEPVPKALFYLSQLLAQGHKIKIITSRSSAALSVAQEWCCRRQLRLDFVSVFKQAKTEAARGLDLYIDDDLHKLEPLVGIVPKLFLFGWGYNSRDNEDGIAVRVFSWQEFYEAINA